MALEFVFAAIVFGLVFAGMAIGVILRNKPIQGSCGGLGNLRDADGKSFCEACTEPCAELEQELRRRGYTAQKIARVLPPSEEVGHPS